MVSVIEVFGGGGQVEKVEIQDEGFAIEVDGELLSPVITTEIETEGNARRDMLSDNCGNTEARTAEQHPKTLTVQGLVTKDRSSSNLSMQVVRDQLREGQVHDVECDIFSGAIELTNVVLTQSSELNYFSDAESGDRKNAYSFQLQFGEEESENGGLFG